MALNSRFIVPSSAAQERVVSLEGAEPFCQNTFSTVWILNKHCVDDDDKRVVTISEIELFCQKVLKNPTETNPLHFIPVMQGLL